MNMLEVRNLHVQYGSITALKDVSLKVNQGEAVGVVGPNGAGKTTLLRTLVGVLAPIGGQVLYEDESIVGVSPESIVRRGIALVPEGRHIFGTLTVAENLRLGATPREDRSSLSFDTERMLALFPALRRYYRSSAGKLSGGEQQQLAIARALLSKPRLLLLDEPSLGLSPRVVDVIFTVLAQLVTTGVTILLVEQSAKRAIEFAARSYVLRNGLVTMSGTGEVLLNRPDFTAAYLGV